MRRLKRDDGASAVEFAIIASLLFLVLFGVIQFGILLNRFQGLQAAGREGARLGALTQTDLTGIRERVKESVSIISASSIQDTPCPGTLGDEKGCVRIEQRDDLNGDGDTTDGGERVDVSGQAGDYKPCNSPPGTGRFIYVEIRYRAPLNIPFWNFGGLTVSGAGEFRCEGGL